ncbi:cytochrome P450 [Aspergillus homomorphus CBS 101889]|uniref:Cytochrome P450 n=1 Tax=Aspergillus homomorphus (strain CBS 101889) TaxID=1450537 RepID=A0A395I3I0_ASPHC|nr:cytochrome P450 [Aspergillus homomorphus CBS 101889]RAL14762.1 cytochrome P450 [Aspergillus homomorphus CBS 101889]
MLTVRPISRVSVLGQRLIILNDANLAIELLDKRSAVHSDRPKMPFAELCFKAYRKSLHREIVSKASSFSRFNSLQEVEVRRFILRLLNRPEDLVGHIRKLDMVTQSIPSSDPLVDLADEAVEQFFLARTANVFRKQSQAVADTPFAFVHQQMSQPGYEPSFASNLLEGKVLTPGSTEKTVIKWSSATLYAAGADTTVSTTTSFFLAMALYPEVQHKAQEEIDRVIGPSRLPVESDRPNLPYIDALVKEALRWHPVAPMGIPHRSMEDDICEGYLIPKGSLIIPNIWAFCHDPTGYENPMTFNPGRFLCETPERDPHYLAFGFGRRVCPGRTLADSNIFLAIAQTLASCHISKAVRDGKEMDVCPEFVPGTISHPAPFEVSVTPRSAQYEEMIRALETEHPWETAHAEKLWTEFFEGGE